LIKEERGERRKERRERSGERGVRREERQGWETPAEVGIEAHKLREAAVHVPRYRGTSLIRNTPLLGSYSRTFLRVLRWSLGGWLFLMREVPL
jgi:hypothetical protein